MGPGWLKKGFIIGRVCLPGGVHINPKKQTRMLRNARAVAGKRCVQDWQEYF